ncbi:antibiotic biosynthesis monooxygenase [Streptomyces sp. NPDC002537]
MVLINPGNGHFTAIELFTTETRDDQERLVAALREGTGATDSPGWVSSTVHAGIGRPGAADFTQWSSAEEMEAHYATAARRWESQPALRGLITGATLLTGKVVSSQNASPDDERVELSPSRDDFTGIAVMGVAPENQGELIAELTRPRDEWVDLLQGYRTHSVLRGLDGTFVVNYAQWDSEDAYWGFHKVPEEQWPLDIRASRDRARAMTVSSAANTYRVVSSRSASYVASAA